MDELDKLVSDLAQRLPDPEDFIRAIEGVDLSGNQKGEFFIKAGIRLYDFSHFKLALMVWFKALGYYIQLNDRSGESWCYFLLADAYSKLEDVRKAIEYREKALEIAKEIGYRAGEARCYESLGGCLLLFN